MTVAALYVDIKNGPYPALPGVDCWGFAEKNTPGEGGRDAREYNGPWPVVAHPPCGPWGMFSWRYKGGEGTVDCAVRAVEQVRRLGGVLEHPAQSKLWKFCDLPEPGDGVDEYDGHTLVINQVDFGFPSEKPTRLYIVRGAVPPLPPPGAATRVMVRKRSNGNDLPEVPKRHRHLTPPAFAKFLVSIADSCNPQTKSVG